MGASYWARLSSLTGHPSYSALSLPFTLGDTHSHRAGVAVLRGREGPIQSQRQQLTWASASWIIRISSPMRDCVAFISLISLRRSLQRFVV